MSSDKIRKVNTRGQITIPAEQRKDLGLQPQTEVLIQADGDELRIRKWGEDVLRKKWTRRSLLRIGGTFTFASGLASIGSYMEYKIDKKRERERQLLRLVNPATSVPSLGLIPAAHHPFLPLPVGDFYAIEKAAAESF